MLIHVKSLIELIDTFEAHKCHLSSHVPYVDLSHENCNLTPFLSFILTFLQHIPISHLQNYILGFYVIFNQAPISFHFR